MHNTLRSGHHEQNSPNTTNHELSLNDSTNGTLRRTGGTNSQTHTLTKTNPYRHKVLTNGSFLNLNLKDVVGPLHSSGSDDASNSSRPTTSTEDTNSDSGNENVNKVLRRSKSNNNNNNRFANGQNPPDLLPPPDGFDNSIQQQQQQAQQPYTIDTNTAKAIIDTYSGHLFSRSTNYHSFRGAKNTLGNGNTTSTGGSKKYPSSAVENLFTRDPTNFEQDSLDNSASNYYDQRHCTVVVQGTGPTPPNSSTNNKPNNNNTNTAPRVKTRTESVV